MLTFQIRGHENTLALHKNTLEFTKDEHLTKRGDCIVGVGADFEYGKVKELINNNPGKVSISLYDKNPNIKDEIVKDKIIAELNPSFDHQTEMVIRKSDFKDKRTFAIKADKAACDLNRKIIETLKNPAAVVFVEIKPLG